MPQQIRQAGGEAKTTAGELASQGRDVGQTADKELKQAGDQAAGQVMAVFCAPVEGCLYPAHGHQLSLKLTCKLVIVIFDKPVSTAGNAAC
jgi:hypothetical protein